MWFSSILLAVCKTTRSVNYCSWPYDGLKRNVALDAVVSQGRARFNWLATQTSTSKQLVNVNNPDKVLFVGEALVGNEAVDQLGRFDRSLKSFSGLGGRSRGIDGIILVRWPSPIVSRHVAERTLDQV
jgi:hypothetical protein